MGNWSTRTAAITELRTQMQDTATPQRYTDAELGAGIDEAIAALSAARPILTTVTATLDSTLVVRLDNQIGASVFGSIVSVVDVTDEDALPASGSPAVHGYQYFEASSQHKIQLPATLASGDEIEIQVRGGYGFSISATLGGVPVTVDTNIPQEWREPLIQGAQGYVLELYGAREVGRTNVAPAVAQQTARAAAVKLRDFRQWLAALPFSGEMRAFVAWGMDAVDERTSFS